MSVPHSYAAESPSHQACMAWRFEMDIRPLIDLLSAGSADVEAQKLAGDLLMQATKRRLAYKPRFRMRTEVMLSHWAGFRSMGTPSEDAKQAVADMYGVTFDAVEKLITRNPAFVAQLKTAMKFD